MANIPAIVAAGAIGVGLYKKFTNKNPANGKTPPNTVSVSFSGFSEETRVKLRVPPSYISGRWTSGFQTMKGDDKESSNQIEHNGGIIFPYTPTISYDNTANYTPTSTMHSNFAYYSYKNSAIGAISLNAKFTVQNNNDAIMYLNTIHLLRSLTKMPFGSDTLAGAPPPVCRLDAYGLMMIYNVPVVVSSFKTELPDGIDYFRISSDTPWSNRAHRVPTLSTITLSLLPVYSRNEQLKFNLTDYRDDWVGKQDGYL